MNTSMDMVDQAREQRRATPPKKKGKLSWLKKFCLYSGLIYGTLLLALMVNETVLVYPGSKYPKGNWEPNNFLFEEVTFTAGDSTKLVGWFLARTPTEPDQTPPPISETILYCHGNAENVAQTAGHHGIAMRKVLNADVFVFDYRGYGKSEGSPSEPGILDDSERALEWLCERTGKTPDQITLVGHSLGGGPACYLASKHNCRALILQRTFKSLADAAQYNYPMFPVKMIMKNQYNSIERIKGYNGPLFQSHGGGDKLIPISHARELFDTAPTTQKKFVEYPDMGHYQQIPKEYWSELRRFFESL